MKTYAYVEGWSRETGKKSHVKVYLELETGKLLNPRAIALSSLVGWGKVQDCETMSSSFGYCVWVSTPGHGGFILVTQTPLPFEVEPAQEWEFKRVSGGEPIRIFAYEFEEDCAWAILVYKDSALQNADYERYVRNSLAARRIPKTREDFMQGIMRTLHSYFPAILREETPVMGHA